MLARSLSLPPLRKPAPMPPPTNVLSATTAIPCSCHSPIVCAPAAELKQIVQAASNGVNKLRNRYFVGDIDIRS